MSRKEDNKHHLTILTEGVGRISALIPTYIDLHTVRVPCSVHSTSTLPSCRHVDGHRFEGSGKSCSDQTITATSRVHSRSMKSSVHEIDDHSQKSFKSQSDRMGG